MHICTSSSRDFHPLHRPYGEWTWHIVDSVTPDAQNQPTEYKHHGIIGFDFKKKVKDWQPTDNSKQLLELLMYLWPGNNDSELTSE